MAFHYHSINYYILPDKCIGLHTQVSGSFFHLSRTEPAGKTPAAIPFPLTKRLLPGPGTGGILRGFVHLLFRMVILFISNFSMNRGKCPS
jgi:hypothetical protein